MNKQVLGAIYVGCCGVLIGTLIGGGLVSRDLNKIIDDKDKIIERFKNNCDELIKINQKLNEQYNMCVDIMHDAGILSIVK